MISVILICLVQENERQDVDFSKYNGESMPLIDYIALNYSGNQSAFARHMGVSRQKVNGWISDGWIVVNNQLYSPRRTVPELGS